MRKEFFLLTDPLLDCQEGFWLTELLFNECLHSKYIVLLYEAQL